MPSRLPLFIRRWNHFRPDFGTAYMAGMCACCLFICGYTGVGIYTQHLQRSQWQVTGSLIVEKPAMVDCGFGDKAEEVRYSYRVDGKEYTERVGTHCGSKHKHLHASNYAPGGFNYVYFNPANPSESSLDNGGDNSTAQLFIVFFAAGAAGFARLAVLQYRGRVRMTA